MNVGPKVVPGCRVQGELKSRSELVPAFPALLPLGSLVLCSQWSQGLGCVGQVYRRDSCTGALGGFISKPRNMIHNTMMKVTLLSA